MHLFYLFDLGCRQHRAASREDDVQRFEFLAAFFGQRPHTAFSDHQLHAGLLNELFFKGFHTHAGGRADGDHLPFITVFTHNRPGVENRFAVEIVRNGALEFDQAAVTNVATGHQRSGQVDHIANADIFQVFGFDRGSEDLFHNALRVWDRFSKERSE